jgi:hypothetical protein
MPIPEQQQGKASNISSKRKGPVTFHPKLTNSTTNKQTLTFKSSVNFFQDYEFSNFILQNS